MLRDNLVGLIEPMCNSAGVDPLALCIARQLLSDDRPPCLENPRPAGAESTLTGNALLHFTLSQDKSTSQPKGQDLKPLTFTLERPSSIPT